MEENEISGIERWRGKVALVTGASSGIGEATAKALANAGMKVVVAARRVERLNGLSAELSAGGGEVLVVPADLGQEPEVLSLFAAIRERWNAVDVLINNAGAGADGVLAEGQTEDWRRMLAVNVLAATICMREAVADMEGKADAHIINVSSLFAYKVMKESAFYSATKYALRALTEGMRVELAAKKSTVRIGMISPGVVLSELRLHASRGKQDSREMKFGFRPLGAEDIAGLICYMLSTPSHVEINDVIVRGRGQAF